MKKVLVFGLIIVLMLCVVGSVKAQDVTADKVKAYIDQLDSKLKEANTGHDQARIQKLQTLIKEQTGRLAKISGEEVAPAEKSSDEQLAEFKEDTNKALAELKGQVDTVKADNSDVKVGAQVFFRFQKYTQGGTAATPSNFDVDRAYLDFKKKLAAGASGRITLDVSRISGASKQNLFDYLKYAYVELPVDIPASLQLVPFSLTGKVGLQHTVWIDWADKMLGLRFLAKSLIDNEGVMASSDFGLGALGKLSIAGMPEIEYHATLVNGTGYSAAESDSKKALAARINLTVYADENIGNFTVGGYGNVEALDTNLKLSSSNKQAGLGFAYQHTLGRAFLEYVTGSKSNYKISGYSLGGALNLGNLTDMLAGYSLFARADQYDPNTNKANDQKNKSFYGITYDWGKDVKFALDMQNAQTGGGATTGIVYLHSMITL